MAKRLQYRRLLTLAVLFGLSFAGLGYRVQPDFPTINWTVDQLAKGIFYHARELNDAFTSVFT